MRALLNALPRGVTFIGDSSDFTEERLLYLKTKRDQELARVPTNEIKLREYQPSDQGAKSKVILVCQFTIEIEAVTVKGLIAMRPVLPKEEYKLIKNLKCARETRKRRKDET